MLYNSATDPPDFDEAHVFAKELEKYPLNEEDIMMDIAEFYTGWATSLKLKLELDPAAVPARRHSRSKLPLKSSSPSITNGVNGNVPSRGIG
jgi:hypothetical protein